MAKSKDENAANSVDTENPAYVGVDPIYQNAASVTEAPFNSEDEEVAAAEKAAKEHEEALAAANPGFRGYTPDTPHPSDAKNPADRFINANKAVVDRMAADAAPADDTAATPATEASGSTPAPD